MQTAYVSGALYKQIVATLPSSSNKESALKRKHASGCTQQDVYICTVYIVSCIILTHAITRHHF